MSPQTREEVFKVVRKHQGRLLSALIMSDQYLEGRREEPLVLEYKVGTTTFAPAHTAGISVFEDLESAQKFIGQFGVHIYRRPAILVGEAALFTGEDARKHQDRLGYTADCFHTYLPVIKPAVGLAALPGARLAASFTPTKVLPKEDLPVPYRPVEEA